MSQRSISAINRKAISRRLPTTRFLHNTPIIGWDTETADGSPFLLCFAHETGAYRTFGDHNSVLQPRTIFEQLTRDAVQGCLNVWYNMDYDAGVILSALPRAKVTELMLTTRTEWEGYDIFYLRRKCLSIKKGHKTYRHYDASQFFYGSLEAAARSWLGEGKKNEGIDVRKFGLTNGKPNPYIVVKWPRILEYIASDSLLVARLFRAFATEAENYDIPCARPYSTGYLAEATMSHIFKTENSRPGFAYAPMQELAYGAYYGGRFEIVERGEIGDVVFYDINSAYPNVMRNLPDPATVRWKRTHKLPTGEYGVVRARVWTDPNYPLQPFPVRLQDGRVIYPILEGHEIASVLPEFQFAMESGLITDFEILEAWNGTTDHLTRYPFTWIDDLYARRMALKKAGKDKAAHVVKIILNSLYGKLIQVTQRARIFPVDESPPFNGSTWDMVPHSILPREIQTYLGPDRELWREQVAGRFFNPFLAAMITGQTRTELLRVIYDSELQDHTVLLATDGIAVRAEYAHQFARKPHATRLGAWGEAGRGRLFVAGSGVYELSDADGRILSLRTRGWEPGAGVRGLEYREGGSGLREAAKAAVRDPKRAGDVIPIETHRPYSLIQAVRSGRELRDVGVFSPEIRGIAAGADRKRRWPRGEDVTWGELLATRERSAPLRLTRAVDTL